MAEVSIRNQGIAPFYYDWSIELALLNSNRELAKVWVANGWSLKGQLPGVIPFVRKTKVERLGSKGPV